MIPKKPRESERRAPLREPLLDEQRKRQERAAERDGGTGFVEDRLRLLQVARRRLDAPLRVPRASAHRRLAVEPLAGSAPDHAFVGPVPGIRRRGPPREVRPKEALPEIAVECPLGNFGIFATA